MALAVLIFSEGFDLSGDEMRAGAAQRTTLPPCHPPSNQCVRAMTLWAVHQQWMAHALNAMHRDASFCSTTIYLHLGALERS